MPTKHFNFKKIIIYTLAILAVFATLKYLGILTTILSTDLLTLKIGELHVPFYLFLKVFLTIITMLWINNIIIYQLKNKILNIKKVTTSNTQLILKIVTTIMYVIIFFISLDILGVNLSSIAFFSGAITVALGFGLQKITSNFVSGIILLLEKSIKPGDLIELNNGTIGLVLTIYTRFTLLKTFSGKVIIIPNEDMMTNKIINWTYYNKKGEVKISVKLFCDTTVKKAQLPMLDIANSNIMVSKDPKPVCTFKTFKEGVIEMQLVVWLKDVTNGIDVPINNIKLVLFEEFKANGIKCAIP